MERSRSWAVRCWHEFQCHEVSSFVTLTYEKLPKGGNLVPSDALSFIRRTRERLNSGLRYFLCGEYGAEARPHYHALLFGVDFPDRVLLKSGSGGSPVYRSKLLESLWTQGFSSCGNVTFASAAYVARYCVKKVGVTNYGAGRVPEFVRMSLRPGLGAPWLQRYLEDAYPSGKVVHQGKEVKVPRYYDKLYRLGNEEEYQKLSELRRAEMDLRFDELSPARLRAREEIMKARGRSLKRELK